MSALRRISKRTTTPYARKPLYISGGDYGTSTNTIEVSHRLDANADISFISVAPMQKELYALKKSFRSPIRIEPLTATVVVAASFVGGEGEEEPATVPHTLGDWSKIVYKPALGMCLLLPRNMLMRCIR